MEMTGNTILITGGGSGIGRGLAERLQARGNAVVIAGRRGALLREVAGRNPGMGWIELDVADPASIAAAAERVGRDYPALNVLVNGAGIQEHEGWEPTFDDALLVRAVTTNLLGPVRLTSALLPRLLAQPRATVVNITSMLGDLPLAVVSSYCAAKAALHSYTLSLRYKLRNTSVEVLELAPPYVQTPLMNAATDPRAMPLGQFLDETMAALERGDAEVLVPAARARRDALRTGELEAMTRMNDLVGDI